MSIVNQTHWDIEADVIAVGSGLGGLTSAILAYDDGASAVVLEEGPSGLSNLRGMTWGCVAGRHAARR